MKYKAKKDYRNLGDSKNFISLLSTSTHLRLLDGLEIEYNKSIPKELKECLTTVSKKQGDK